jgi:hypothetical protein
MPHNLDSVQHPGAEVKTMPKTYDVYCADVADLRAAQSLVERSLSIHMTFRNSTYWGGDYYLARSAEFGEVALRPNFNSFTGELNEREYPDCRFIVWVSAPADADATRARLVAGGLRFLSRTVVDSDQSRSRRMVVVEAHDAAAKGLAAVTIEVDTKASGLFARPFPGADLLLLLNGPPGAPLAVGVWDCGKGAAAELVLEDVVRSKLVPPWARSLSLGERTDATVDGELRPALTFITNEGAARTAWFGVILDRPGGAVFVAAGVAAGKAASVSVDGIMANPAVGTAVRSLRVR